MPYILNHHKNSELIPGDCLLYKAVHQVAVDSILFLKYGDSVPLSPQYNNYIFKLKRQLEPVC